jgi:hypothetical protein
MERVAAYACIALSAAFIAIDVAGGGLSPRRPDLVFELFARVLMLVLAFVAIRRTRGDPNLRLLLWAVILVSFDTYWQSTSRHFGGKPLEWVEMIVKYVAVGAGLGLLLRLCARFGDAPPSRLRSLLAGSALALGGVLAAVGIGHGVLYIGSCHYFVPGRDQCIVDDAALFALQAYLVVDALLRALIVVAAITGYVRSSAAYKQRTLLVAAASIVFALGTAIDFLGRLQLTYDTATMLQLADAIATLVFPLALLYAATQRRLFDVEYAVKLGVSYALAAAILTAMWKVTLIVAEVVLHSGALKFLVPASESPATRTWQGELPLELAVGVPFLLAWRPLEGWLEHHFDALIMPERTKRRGRLRAFIAQIPFIDSLVELEQTLQHALTRGISATFADIFWHDGKNGYGAYLSSRNPRPPYLHEDDPPVPKVVQGRPVCLKCRHATIPGAELALPMPVGGKTVGILVCGPPESRDVTRYAADEVADIKAFAATAAGALFALRANVKRPARVRAAAPVPRRRAKPKEAL